MVTGEVLDQSWQHLPPWCLQLPALGLATSQSGYRVWSAFKPVPHCLTDISQESLSCFFCLFTTLCSLFLPNLKVLIFIFIFKQVTLCTELWRAATEGCVHEAETGSCKKEEDPPGPFLSLSDPSEDLLGSHALFWVCHLNDQGAVGTGWEQAVLVPVAQHRKAFTNNEAL